MADTPIAVDLPVGVWIDLYEATGILRGSKLIVHNIGNNDIYLATSPERPALDTKAYQTLKPGNIPMKNDGGSAAEWAFSPNQEIRINVRKF